VKIPHIEPRRRERAPAYNALKVRWMDTITALARAQYIPHMSALRRADLAFMWAEPDHRRDPDNVAAGGRKLILDALVIAGVLATDGARHVGSFGDVFAYGMTTPGVVVTLSDGKEAATFTIPHRLPDLNELLAARDAGARRMIYRAAGRSVRLPALEERGR